MHPDPSYGIDRSGGQADIRAGGHADTRAGGQADTRAGQADTRAGAPDVRMPETKTDSRSGANATTNVTRDQTETKSGLNATYPNQPTAG